MAIAMEAIILLPSIMEPANDFLDGVQQISRDAGTGRSVSLSGEVALHRGGAWFHFIFALDQGDPSNLVELSAAMVLFLRVKQSRGESRCYFG